MATYTFDPTTRSITLDVGARELDVKDIYSRWKDWVKATDEGKNAPAFLSVGGNEIDATAGTEIPAYIYLTNGWHVHPDEADHTLNVTNGILLVDGGGDPFRDTVGAYTVRVNYQQPVQAITTPGLIMEAILESGVTTEQALRLILSALAGVLSGAPGPGTITIRDVNDTKDRISATVDANGNRTAVTLDGD
jgi:hypothetical protein